MRIASLVSAATEMLYALGLGDQVVAISHECDWPAECQRLPRVTRSNIDAAADSAAIDTQVRALLAAGRPLYEIDVERLASLRPDLIVTQSQCNVCAISETDVTAAVRRHEDLRSAQVLTLTPSSLDDVLQDISRLGSAASAAVAADNLISQLRARIDRVQQRTANEFHPRVAIIEWTEPVMLAGNWVPEILQIAGGQCVLTPPGQPSCCIDWSTLISFNPEVIIVCPCGFDLARATAEVPALAARRGWNSLPAVKSGNIFVADGNACFNRPGPRLIDTLENLLSALQNKRGSLNAAYFARL